MEWLPIGLIVFGAVAGGAMHWMAARTISASGANQPSGERTAHAGGSVGQMPLPSIEVLTTGYPLRVNPAGSTTLIEWRNKHDPTEGGRVDLIKGSIHVELWNRSGQNRTQKLRLLRFS